MLPTRLADPPVTPTPASPRRAAHRLPTSALGLLYRFSRAGFVAAIVVGLVGGLTGTLLLRIISAAMKQGPKLHLAVLFTINFVFILLCRVGSRLFIGRLVYGALVELRMSLATRILHSSLARLEATGNAALLAVLADDVATISSALWVLPDLFINATVVLGCLVYVAILVPRLAVFVIAACAIGIFAMAFLLRFAHRHTVSTRAAMAELYKHFRALTDGIKDLKLRADREDDFYRSMREAAELHRHHSESGVRVVLPAEQVAFLVIYGVVGLMLFVLPIDVYVQADCILAVLVLSSAVSSVGSTLSGLGRANTALRKIDERLPDPGGEDRPIDRSLSSPSWRELRAIGVTLAYVNHEENASFVVGPVDMTFRPGEIVFLVGGNGSGKTSFAKLVTGLYSPDFGRFELDGRVIVEADLPSYRQMFSATFADSFIFEGILGGGSVVERDAECQRLLRRLRLEHKVDVKDGNFTTLALSQGQRKRLALLSVYMEDRPFLVFDEWAADQDPVFRDLFYRELLPELKARGKSILAITHDDKYFPCADRLLRIDNGTLREVDAAEREGGGDTREPSTFAHTPGPIDRTTEKNG